VGIKSSGGALRFPLVGEGVFLESFRFNGEGVLVARFLLAGEGVLDATRLFLEPLFFTCFVFRVGISLSVVWFGDPG